MIEAGWVMTLALLVDLTLLEIVTWARRRQCVRSGHAWQGDRGGFRCRRCWRRFLG